MASDLHLLPKFRDRLSYLYVEHAVVEREANSIALYGKDGDDLHMTQVPVCDIALLMLGPGTKLSHAAVDVLARNNCLVAWTGEEGCASPKRATRTCPSNGSATDRPIHVLGLVRGTGRTPQRGMAS
jgi:hypothetical protein